MHELERYGPVEALNHGKRVFGLPPLMTVRCYAVDGLLIDAGLSALSREVRGFAEARGVTQVAVTHHHEDHSNGAAGLVEAGYAVRAGAHTRAILQRGFGTRLYQKLCWGRSRPVEVGLLPDRVETERHVFDVLPAPGHCEDQVVLYEPDQGWLFSGDVFLHERVRVFRADEDFAATMHTLRRLCALEVSALFCAHRPVPEGGGQALRSKLQHLEDVEGAVRALHAKGYPERAIAREVLGQERGLWILLAWGDASRLNLVRAILSGPRPRPDTGP